MTKVIEQFVSRFGTPVMFQGEGDDAPHRYARETQELRNSMPPGECQVAPRVSFSTWYGRPLEPGMRVTASDFGEGDAGKVRLDQLVQTGHVLRSERQTAEERAEIAQAVERVRELNAAFRADAPAAKLDQLLEHATK